MSYAPGMGELLLFSIPSLIYLAVLGRRSRLGAAEARKRQGLMVGEEILFRGLIGGVLIRRLGFWVGNTAQAVVFLLPHALLLAVDPRIWPILPVQFLAGWMLGWLRHRSGSVLPGALVHAAVNLLVGVLVA